LTTTGKVKKNRILLQAKTKILTIYKRITPPYSSQGNTLTDTDTKNMPTERKQEPARPPKRKQPDLLFANIGLPTPQIKCPCIGKRPSRIGKGCVQTSRIDAPFASTRQSKQFCSSTPLQVHWRAIHANSSPFSDCAQMAQRSRDNRTLVQPGGSMRDNEHYTTVATRK